MNPQTLALDAADLSTYELTDIEAGLEWLRIQERREGESAYPDMGTMIVAIKRFRSTRKAAEDKAKQEADDAASKEDFRLHPENYITSAETQAMLERLAKKVNFDKPREIDQTPVMVACARCGFEHPVARNMRFWDPDEIEAYAKLLREVRAVAAANREIALAELQARLAEQVAGDVK